MGELYTCKDVAERYGVQIITVWEWIRKKKLCLLYTSPSPRD